MNYITRTGGATVTVFVPYDCQNHCPFCINKAEYSDTSKFSLDEIIRSIKIMDAMTPECDFVFTGGEPLADLDALQKMLDVIPTTHKIFINTTLPINQGRSESEIAGFLNKNYFANKITGINVSRHLKPFVQECSDSIFKMLAFKPRINCVLYSMDSQKINIVEALKAFADRFKDITSHIQFRKDYVVTDMNNLYNTEDDEIFQVLTKAFDYVGPFGEYRMRVGYEFRYGTYKITYHKTLPYSKIYINNNESCLYDIIIKQDGTIKEDWDTCINTKTRRVCDNIALPLDLTAYKNVRYEEYK